MVKLQLISCLGLFEMSMKGPLPKVITAFNTGNLLYLIMFLGLWTTPSVHCSVRSYIWASIESLFYLFKSGKKKKIFTSVTRKDFKVWHTHTIPRWVESPHLRTLSVWSKSCKNGSVTHNYLKSASFKCVAKMLQGCIVLTFADCLRPEFSHMKPIMFSLQSSDITHFIWFTEILFWEVCCKIENILIERRRHK